VPGAPASEHDERPDEDGESEQKSRPESHGHIQPETG